MRKTDRQSAQTKKAQSKMSAFSLYNIETQPQQKNCTAQQYIKGLDFDSLKKFKSETVSKIEKLTEKKAGLSENLQALIDRKIQKMYFHLQTYSQQVFDLHFETDSLTKYNYDLLHFDLLLKSENLNSQLLYYRLIDTKNRCKDFDTYTMDTEYVKWAVYNKTERAIIENMSNSIILSEIEKNDSIKLEFIKIYYKNLNNKTVNDRKTISNYKKYIIDRYSYLLSN